MEATRHPREDARLASLYRLGMLDTGADPRFDDVAELASFICGTPVALVSLVDADRQWFKSRVGLAACETDLSRSVCAHTILGDAPLEIADTAADPRTADNPLGDEIGMRFYAGVPLVGRDGLPYGSLCVLDTRPRALSPAQRDALRRLARQVVVLLETEVTLREREAALARAEVLKEEIDHRVANSLQQVAALLRLQARAHANDGSHEAIDLARQRVEAIASFHKSLVSLSDGHQIRLEALLGRLVEDLSANLPPEVRIECAAEPVQIGARYAVPIAMILNECVANSVKYAFPGGRAGVIRVTAASDGGVLTLAISDDGPGAGSHGGAAGGTGIGMKVIESAALSLSADLAFSGEDGFRVRLEIPLEAVRPSAA